MGLDVTDRELRETETLTEETLERKRQHVKKRAGDFVKGLRVDWFVQSCRVGKVAMCVGVALWFRAGLTKSQTGIKFSQWLADRFDLDRFQTYSGLESLQRAGLITVDRRRGRSPLVDILPVSPISEGDE